MKFLGLLGLVFDTGLTVTPLLGRLGCLASHWSVPVVMAIEVRSWKEANISDRG